MKTGNPSHSFSVGIPSPAVDDILRRLAAWLRPGGEAAILGVGFCSLYHSVRLLFCVYARGIPNE